MGRTLFFASAVLGLGSPQSTPLLVAWAKWWLGVPLGWLAGWLQQLLGRNLAGAGQLP